jgi:hypothetical protein
MIHKALFIIKIVPPRSRAHRGANEPLLVVNYVVTVLSEGKVNQFQEFRLLVIC